MRLKIETLLIFACLTVYAQAWEDFDNFDFYRTNGHIFPYIMLLIIHLFSKLYVEYKCKVVYLTYKCIIISHQFPAGDPCPGAWPGSQTCRSETRWAAASQELTRTCWKIKYSIYTAVLQGKELTHIRIASRQDRGRIHISADTNVGHFRSPP